MTTRKELLPGVFLTSIQDGRFKTACFSLSFLRPLRQEEAGMNALLPSVLLRGSEKTPSIRAIADRLDELHGASIGALVRKKGEIQLTGLFADCLEDQYAGEAVFSHLLDFVSELLFCPRTEHGAFVPELVSQECRNLQNAMQSVLDDKGAYCERQMAMCRGERYACGRLGEPEELDKIDVRTLWAHDKSVLASSRVELFYLGSKSVGEAEALLQPLLAHLPRTACVPVGTNPGPQPQALRRFSEVMPLAQSRISLGFRTFVDRSAVTFRELTDEEIVDAITRAQGADILRADSGKVYIGLVGYDDDYVLYTNDPAYAKQAPQEFEEIAAGHIQIRFAEE